MDSNRIGSYEKEMRSKLEKGEQLPEKIDIPMLKYFWQTNPIIGNSADSVPRFLRKINVLQNFTDNELRLLSKSLHLRTFSAGENIFNQGELGMGFYFIYTGQVSIVVLEDARIDHSEKDSPKSKHIVTLDKFDYFGELALLQEKSVRNATATTIEGCQLLGIFKPDFEELSNDHPVVATKLLQSVSVIIANRLFSLTSEVRKLKYKIAELEKKNDK